jgi:hypothetical protein
MPVDIARSAAASRTEDLFNRVLRFFMTISPLKSSNKMNMVGGTGKHSAEIAFALPNLR